MPYRDRYVDTQDNLRPLSVNSRQTWDALSMQSLLLSLLLLSQPPSQAVTHYFSH